MTLLWWWILALIPLPWLIWRLPAFRQLAKTSGPLLYLPDWPAHTSPAHGSKPVRPGIRWWLFWTLLICALSRPVLPSDPIRLEAPARSLMLAVDLSPSMGEQDMILNRRRASRLEVVRRVLDHFLSQREGDRVGLIVFGRQAYLHAPLTFDIQTVRTLLSEARLGMAGDRTAIGDAIGLGIKKLRDLPASQRVLILLTDGANTAGQVPPEEAARRAAGYGIRIHTVGIGEPDRRGRSADPDTLRQIAEQTSGLFFNAGSTPELELAYETLNRIEPIKVQAQSLRPVRELFMWPLILAWVVLLTPSVIGRRRHG
ncbi:MAG: VWA domain-containing protein [Gammaproteobacteria bacterium]|nr:MAG: VWA domain-containing protein [Gammaproteobacteria bacterium]